MDSLSFGSSISISLLGFLIVFLVLVSLIVVIRIIAYFAGDKESSAAVTKADGTATASAKAASATADNANKVPAKGSLGEIKLGNVDDKTAAIIMCIVAEKLDTPLNQLRFISIEEIN